MSETFLAPSDPVAYRVTVDNIGLVLETYDDADGEAIGSLEDEARARDTFEEYIQKSKSGDGRAADERVFLFEENHIIDEYDPDRRHPAQRVADFVEFECSHRRVIRDAPTDGRSWHMYWNPRLGCTMIVEYKDRSHAPHSSGPYDITEIYLPTPDEFAATYARITGEELEELED